MGKWPLVWWPKARLCTGDTGVLRRGGGGEGWSFRRRVCRGLPSSRREARGCRANARVPAEGVALGCHRPCSSAAGDEPCDKAGVGSVMLVRKALQRKPAPHDDDRADSPPVLPAPVLTESPSRAILLSGAILLPGDIWGHVWFATPEREGAAGIEWLRSRLAA